MRPRVVVAIATVAATVGVLAAVDTWRQAPDEPTAGQPTRTLSATDDTSAAVADTGQPLAPDGSGPVTHRSARIEDIDDTAAPSPQRLRIPTLVVDAPVTALGVAPDGQMEVPADADTVAWYEHGPSPRRAGVVRARRPRRLQRAARGLLPARRHAGR